MAKGFETTDSVNIETLAKERTSADRIDIQSYLEYVPISSTVHNQSQTHKPYAPYCIPCRGQSFGNQVIPFRAFFAKEWLRSLFHLLIDPRITTASICQQWSKSYLLVLLVEDTASILNLSGSPQVRSNNVVYCGIPYTSVYPIINNNQPSHSWGSYYWVYHINMLFNHDSLLPVWKRNAIGRESVPNWARRMAWSAPWLRAIWESPSVVLRNGWAVLRKSLQNLSSFMLFTCILYTTVIYCSNSKYFDWFPIISGGWPWIPQETPCPCRVDFDFQLSTKGERWIIIHVLCVENPEKYGAQTLPLPTRKKTSTHHFLWIFQFFERKSSSFDPPCLVPHSPFLAFHRVPSFFISQKSPAARFLRSFAKGQVHGLGAGGFHPLLLSSRLFTSVVMVKWVKYLVINRFNWFNLVQ